MSTTTKTNDVKTVKSNAKLESGQSAINAYDPVKIPYNPPTPKHVPESFDHDGSQWYPRGYDMNKHRVLKQSEFNDDALFYAYKSFIHIPWYMRKQQTRIDAWIERMKPKTPENQLSSIINKMMKQTGKTRSEIMELMKNM